MVRIDDSSPPSTAAARQCVEAAQEGWGRVPFSLNGVAEAIASEGGAKRGTPVWTKTRDAALRHLRALHG